MNKIIISLGVSGVIWALPMNISSTRANDHQTPVCMAGQSDQTNKQHSFTIIVTQDKVSSYSARGFVIEDCSSKLNSADIYRQKICSLVQAPQSVKSSFETLYGASPDELCTMVNIALDP